MAVHLRCFFTDTISLTLDTVIVLLFLRVNNGACSSPGELGGDAILDVLDGTFAPTGRLPVTVRVALDISCMLL